MVDNFLPKSVPHGGLILARGDHFWQQKWSGGPILAGGFSAKISPAGPILGGTDFGVTGHVRKFSSKTEIQEQLLERKREQ